jgi:hypothetical protein
MGTEVDPVERGNFSWRSYQFVTSRKARAASHLPGLMHELCEALAEGVGFEPTVGSYPYSGLANPCTCKVGISVRRRETQYSWILMR